MLSIGCMEKIVKTVTLFGWVLLMLCIGSKVVAYSTIGVPLNRVVSSIEETSRELLTEDEQQEYACVIDKVQGMYFWVSRENRKLKRTESGIYEIYTSLDGAGFIKCINPKYKSLFKETSYFLPYFESIHVMSKTITYFGYVPPSQM